MDLNTKDGRKSFFSDNMENLLTAINNTYGPQILEELLKRIDRTIKDFNDEVSEAFVRLKDIDKKRQDAFNQIELDDDNSQPEWEKKLDKIKNK